jgi:hypothetical protein
MNMASIFEQRIEPFQQFIDSLHAARPEHHLNVPNSKIADEQSFVEIRSHLTNYYLIRRHATRDHPAIVSDS